MLFSTKHQAAREHDADAKRARRCRSHRAARMLFSTEYHAPPASTTPTPSALDAVMRVGPARKTHPSATATAPFSTPTIDAVSALLQPVHHTRLPVSAVSPTATAAAHAAAGAAPPRSAASAFAALGTSHSSPVVAHSAVNSGSDTTAL
eukprot:72629-Chlamydomonas_euryale.AAC.2